MDLDRSHIRQVFARLKDHPHGPSQISTLGICPQVPLEILYGTALYSGVPVIVWMRDITPSAISIIHAENLPVGATFVACLPVGTDEHIEIVCRVNAREALGTKLSRADASFDSILDPTQHHMPGKMGDDEGSTMAGDRTSQHDEASRD